MVEASDIPNRANMRLSMKLMRVLPSMKLLNAINQLYMVLQVSAYNVCSQILYLDREPLFL